MGLRESLRPLVDRARAITGPTGLGIRTDQLTVRVRTWAGGRPGAAGTSPHLYPYTPRVTTATATDLPTAVALANAIRSAYIAHAADNRSHAITDTTDVISAAVATDQASAITLVNNVKTVLNAHEANTSVHYHTDSNTVVTANATDLATLIALANAERTAINAHLSTTAVSDSDLVLPMQYRIRQVSQKEVADSGGRYEAGMIIVEHITPYDGVSVGYTVAQLKPPITSDAQERIYVVTSNDPAGGHAGEYDLEELRSWRPFSFDLVLKRKETSP